MATRPFADLEAKMTPAARKKGAQRTRELMEELLLSDLRKIAGMSQAALAASMGVSQPTVSEMEGQDDMQISTIQRLVHALGGTLEIAVTLPGKGRFAISQFSDGPAGPGTVTTANNAAAVKAEPPPKLILRSRQRKRHKTQLKAKAK